jgi:hypothetical protein
MGALRGVAVGLSIVFGGFFLVLLAKLYYLYYRKCRSPWNMRTITNVPIEFTDGSFNFSREDGELRSLQDSRSIPEAIDSDISGTLFPINSEVIGRNDNVYTQGELEGPRDHVYTQGELEGPRLLFTIKEETQDDMRCQESMGNRNFIFSERPARSESPSPNMTNHVECSQKTLD